jgi:hypothetical protein
VCEGHGVGPFRLVVIWMHVPGLRALEHGLDVGRRAVKRHEAVVERRNEYVIRAFVYASKLRRR